MKHLWIIFKTEFNVWRHDPITAMGGIVPCFFILVAFALLFGGRLSFKIAVINQDQGEYGQLLVDTFEQTISPLDNAPYYAVQELDQQAAWRAFEEYHIEGIWVIPADFSERVAAGGDPAVEMYFMNYNDDRAKNHRIYSAEVLWQFYQNIGLDGPPIAVREEYPLPEMVDWVSIISVGIMLLSVTLGSIFNMFILTYKAQTGKVTLEYGLSPRSLGWVLAPKLVLALLFGLATGTIFLLIIWVWLGFWPGWQIFTVWMLAGLVAVFWTQVALVFGLMARNYMPGAVGAVLGAMIIFFIGGGLSMVRAHKDAVTWVAWLFPNTYAVDPLRDLVLFNAWPADFWPVLLKLAGFALFALALGSLFATRKLRRIG
ncbi:MAG: ABC transporter permease [Anaerolineales bacterium]|nr:ABC transporter permease [Anaerolineales bacterium]